MARHQGAVFSLITALLPPGADAESLSERCFLHAERNLSLLENPDEFGMWLIAIARGMAEAAEEKVAKQPKRPPTSGLKGGLKSMVLEALQELTPEDRLTLVLGDMQERSPAEMRAALGLATDSDVEARVAEARARMQEVLQGLASHTPAEPPKPSPEDKGGGFEPGTVLDKRYRIVREIGRGGMGVVYRARHLGIDRDVAIKILPKQFAASEESRARFHREAVMLGRLDHPNFVRVIDSGALDDGGTEFIAMELLEGEPLYRVIKREGRLAPERALHMFRHVLRGLQRAHELGIVHRDIKPANLIVLTHEGDRDFVKILDLGIAKFQDDEDASKGPQLTEPGIIFGTPVYLSPELAIGEDAGPSSDLYTASIVLFEMLAGEVPFSAKDVRSILAMHVSTPPPPVEKVAPEATVPPEVAALLARGMAKRAADRPPDAAAYIAEIDVIVAPDFRSDAPTSEAETPASSDTDETQDGAASPLHPFTRLLPLWAWALVVLAITAGIIAIATR